MKKINSTSKSQCVCILRDKVANTNGTPSTFINKNVAIRSFNDLMNTDMYKLHTSDYELVYIGDYDVSTGELLPVAHSILCKGSDVNV